MTGSGKITHTNLDETVGASIEVEEEVTKIKTNKTKIKKNNSIKNKVYVNSVHYRFVYCIIKDDVHLVVRTQLRTTNKVYVNSFLF